MKSKKCIALFFCFFYSFNCFANEENSNLENFLAYSENIQYKLSSKVNKYCSNIDSFLSNNYSEPKETNKSYINIDFYTELIKNKGFNHNIDFSGKLDLKKLKDRLNLEISNKEQNTEINKLQIEPNKQDKNILTGVTYIHDFLNNFTYKAGVGAKFSGIKIDLYSKLNLGYSKKIFEDLKLNINFENYYFADRGFEHTTDIVLEQTLLENLKIFYSSNFYYIDKNSEQHLSSNITIKEKFKKHTMDYILSMYSNNEVRQEMHFKYFKFSPIMTLPINKFTKFEMKPEIFWDRENSFKTHYGLIFNLNVKFGFN